MSEIREQLEKINAALNAICEWDEFFADQKDEILLSQTDIDDYTEDESLPETFEMLFPGEQGYTTFKYKNLLELCDDIRTIDCSNPGVIKTKLRRYYIVEISGPIRDFFPEESIDIHYPSVLGITMGVVNESIIVGLAAAKIGEYDGDYWGTITPYYSVEIVYDSEERILADDEEKKLLHSFIFEAADNAGMIIRMSKIALPEVEGYCEEKESCEISSLEPYNDGMELFISASRTTDPELQFLGFYKVLEYFSPIAVNIEANELMRKKLDVPRSSFESGDYIRSVFALANAMKSKFNDEELIKATFNTCFDFIGLSSLLPASLLSKIIRAINEKELSYSTDSQKIQTCCNMVGKIIYKTRNRVVHAKSNYEATGEEVSGSDLFQLNIFMHRASSQAIRWYTRQPQHLRLAVV